MFRRFGVVRDEQEQEVLLNLKHISVIEKFEGQTHICLNDGTEYLSTVDYQHLADALDGVRC